MPVCERIGVLDSETGVVLMISWNELSTILAAACYNKAVVLWDANTLRKLHTIASFSEPVLSVAFQPHGSLLAIGTNSLKSGRVQLWRMSPLKSSKDFTFVSSLKPTARRVCMLPGHTDFVLDCAWDPEGRRLITGSRDSTAIVWNVAARRVLAKLKDHSATVTSVAVHPSGKQAATGSRDGTIILWNFATYTLIARLEGHSNGVRSVCFSPDCCTLISGGWDSTAKLWSVKGQTRVATLEGHGDVVNTVAVHRDGKSIVTGSRDSKVKVWTGITTYPWSTALYPCTPQAAKDYVVHLLLIARRLACSDRQETILPGMPHEMWYEILKCMCLPALMEGCNTRRTVQTAKASMEQNCVIC